MRKAEWSRAGSNCRPLDCQSSALPAELRPHIYRRDAESQRWCHVLPKESIPLRSSNRDANGTVPDLGKRLNAICCGTKYTEVSALPIATEEGDVKPETVQRNEETVGLIYDIVKRLSADKERIDGIARCRVDNGHSKIERVADVRARAIRRKDNLLWPDFDVSLLGLSGQRFAHLICPCIDD